MIVLRFGSHLGAQGQRAMIIFLGYWKERIGDFLSV